MCGICASYGIDIMAATPPTEGVPLRSPVQVPDMLSP